MSLAIFGIDSSGLNLAISLLILMLAVLWLALIVYTFTDARRRIEDPFLVACATVASFFPFIGTAVYTIVRPPEFLEDAHERELEIKAAELRVRQLTEKSCPHCEHPIGRDYLRCPSCQKRLKHPCPTCAKPVDPNWALCPFCETALGGGGRRERPAERQSRPERSEHRPERREPRREQAPTPKKRQPDSRKQASSGSDSKKSSAGSSRKQPAAEAPSKEASTSEKPQQRSPRREPDPDPRQA
ncbi:MAG TPA: zinc ribbon domain-containing protein [Solirubrobacterales bacterium]|nr:zinc ribbon domain-containing protein [Solirubrobacterales bacterium]